jgi:hypothetical protein
LAYKQVFIGYAVKFYNLNNKVIIESNDANFNENKFPFKLTNSGGIQSSILVIWNSESNHKRETKLRRSKIVRVANNEALTRIQVSDTIRVRYGDTSIFENIGLFLQL